MNLVAAESHFTGTGNLDRVLDILDIPVFRLNAFESDIDARRACAPYYRFVDVNVFRARYYDRAHIIIGAPPMEPYMCRCSGLVKGISMEWLASLRRVRQCMPVYVFYEGSLHAPWEAVRTRLTQWGYQCALASVRACDVGAPYRRRRVYLLGCLEQINVRQPFYRRNPYDLIPAPAPTMNRSPLTDNQHTKTNFQTWLSKHGDEPNDAFAYWSTVMGSASPSADDFNRNKEVVAEWLMGMPYGWVTDLSLKHRKACQLIANASVWQQAHLALWRTSLAVNRLFT